MSIILKRSEVASKVPLPGDLVLGELAINSTDAKVYTKKGDGSVVDITSELDDVTITNYGEVGTTIASASGGITLNTDTGNVFTVTATGATTITLSTTHVNTNITILLTDNGNTISWNTTILWPGGEAPALSGVNLITLSKIGASWVGGYLLDVQ